MNGRVGTLGALLVLASCSGGGPATPSPTPTPSSLAVSCDTTEFTAVGQQGRCSARVTLTNSTTQDQPAGVQWSSSDPAKVSVSSTGAIAAVAPGSAEISALYSGLSARQLVGVTAPAPPPAPPPPPSVRVLTLTLTQGENLSGPYAGTVTGPNGFSCTLRQSDKSHSCPPAQFSDGQTITLRVTLTVATFDKPIWRTQGCDSWIRYVHADDDVRQERDDCDRLLDLLGTGAQAADHDRADANSGVTWSLLHDAERSRPWARLHGSPHGPSVYHCYSGGYTTNSTFYGWQAILRAS